MEKWNNAILVYKAEEKANVIGKNLSQTIPILSQKIKELTIIATSSPDDLKEVCKSKGANVDLIIVLGGDGTVHLVINSIAQLEKRPAVAILPGGTSNDFSRTLGMPQNLKLAAQSIVNGELVSTDICQANNDYFLNFWGIGLVAETSKNTDDAQKDNLGVLSYFVSTLKTLNQATSFSYQVKTSEGEYDGEARLIFVLNGNFIGTKEIAIRKLFPHDGLLDVLIAKNTNLDSLREIFSLNNQQVDPDQLEELDHFQVEKVEIETKVKMDVDMDGEIYTTTPTVISVLPGHIQMVGAV
ncbi:YegS/Rv2252/BmrU family lipid kinase [Allobacillus salarius]|uniref:YegS/Rv2252/BmrU family lipid kinase n=2 Tax=Bacillaceae TaxID=186817 RepID=A0A556PGT5_9BACI|nr:YegS/Rv2252/BmrU family lipid kinase [Allobacillus salarius]